MASLTFSTQHHDGLPLRKCLLDLGLDANAKDFKAKEDELSFSFPFHSCDTEEIDTFRIIFMIFRKDGDFVKTQKGLVDAFVPFGPDSRAGLL